MKTPGVSVITHEKTPIGVFISIDAFDGFMETLDDLSESDPSFDKDIQEGIQEMKSGKRPKDTVSLDALKKEFYGCRI